MGQHRIQKQILKAFSFAGSQPESREVWCLKSDGFQPVSRSISRLGFFEVNCSENIDDYITALEDTFKDPLHRFSNGTFVRTDVGREVYEFIAMHYVRSRAFCMQIEHVVGECQRQSVLTESQAEAEFKRFTSHQDVSVFKDLVDSAARTLTRYVLYPLVITGPSSFLTSDKIIYAGMAESEQRETFVWFPLSPSTGVCLRSDGHEGQILGPRVELDRRSGRIRFKKLPEASILKCRPPSPEKVTADFVNTMNGLMVQGSTQLYSPARATIDSALQNSEQPSGYRYHQSKHIADTINTA